MLSAGQMQLFYAGGYIHGYRAVSLPMVDAPRRETNHRIEQAQSADIEPQVHTGIGC